MSLKNLTRYVMLKIQVDFATGKRAGGISPHDSGLHCNPSWQDLDAGIELRLVLDDRNIEQYRNMEGVTVVEGIDACNAQIEQTGKTDYSVKEPELMSLSITKKNIKIDDLPTESINAQLEELSKRGALGIRKRGPVKLT